MAYPSADAADILGSVEGHRIAARLRFTADSVGAVVVVVTTQAHPETPTALHESDPIRLLLDTLTTPA